MDNFRRSKRVVSTGNVDGMIRGRMRQGLGPTSARRRPGSVNSASRAAESARIGNFTRKEGFSARKTKPIMPDGRGLGRQRRQATPIDMTIDETPAKKTSLKAW